MMFLNSPGKVVKELAILYKSAIKDVSGWMPVISECA
jgi:hypothetical protein